MVNLKVLNAIVNAKQAAITELMMMAEHTLAVRKSSRLQMQKREHGLKRMRKAIGH